MGVLASAAEIGAGLVLVLAVFYDLFQSVVLPRPAVRKVQLARVLIRPTWNAWRWVGTRSSRPARTESWLAAFGPLALLMLFFVWAIALVLGYSLIALGLADQFHPALRDFPDAFYVSSTTLVPLSYGDFVPEQGAARAAIVAESATGVGVAALAITLLFSLYESFRAREEAVVALDALAGAPPSGVQMLERVAEAGGPPLDATFDEWRLWSAMVLESHLAYPLLVYFRSSHDNEAWLNSFGAVMDAAALTVSALDGESRASAKLMFTIGNHLVEDLTWVLRIKSANDPILERSEFELAVERLRQAGYRVDDVDAAWTKFSELRSHYASVLNQIAHRLALPPAQWMGDRSYLPHGHTRSLRRRRKQTPRVAR